MCFGPSTLGAGAKTRLEFRIKKFMPHCVCRYGVRSTYGMVKLDLDLACLLSHLFKFSTTAYTAHPPAMERPAQECKSRQ